MTSGRPGPCASVRDDLGTSLEVLRHPGLVAAHARLRSHPHGDVGDHPERPLGTDDQFAQGGTGGGVRRLQRAQVAGRRQQAHRADHGVEAPVAAGGLPGGAGGGEAADRRVLEGLREVAEGQALAAQRRLRLRPAQAGAEAGAERAAVDLDLTQRPEVEADQPCVNPAQGLDAADDAGAAAERHDGDPGAGADLEDASQRLRIGRHHDRVRRRFEPTAAHPHQVGVAASACVPQPVLPGIEDRLLPRPPRSGPAAMARVPAARSPPPHAPAATAPARRSARAGRRAPRRRARACSRDPPTPTTSYLAAVRSPRTSVCRVALA